MVGDIYNHPIGNIYLLREPETTIEWTLNKLHDSSTFIDIQVPLYLGATAGLRELHDRDRDEVPKKILIEIEYNWWDTDGILSYFVTFLSIKWDDQDSSSMNLFGTETALGTSMETIHVAIKAWLLIQGCWVICLLWVKRLWNMKHCAKSRGKSWNFSVHLPCLISLEGYMKS